MPSFFEGLKRVISGQPVFRPEEGQDGMQTRPVPPTIEPPASEQAPAAQQAGPKVIPEVIVERAEHRDNGHDMDVDLEVRNHSDRNVLVDRITILGATKQVNLMLRPGEQREIPVYHGPRPNHRNYSSCEVKYRDETTGDYFLTSHFVDFEQAPDQTYVIRHIRFVPPVRDI